MTRMLSTLALLLPLCALGTLVACSDADPAEQTSTGTTSTSTGTTSTSTGTTSTSTGIASMTTSTGAGTAGTGGGGGGGGAGGESATYNSIALLDSQLPASQTPNSWLEPGEAVEATTLFVAVGAQKQSCSTPDFAIGSKNTWLVLIGLPAAAQKPGTYQLSSKDIIAWGSSWLGDGMGNGGGGGQPITTGTVEVLSIDGTSVKVSIHGLEAELASHDGDYTATRCP